MEEKVLKGDKIQACPICGGPVTFTTNDVIYGSLWGTWPYIYLCDDRKCDSYVGCHANTDDPLGTMADARTRKARQRAHDHFDQIWKRRIMKRKDAYIWLMGVLGISYIQCHIGKFDVEMCEKVVKAVLESGFLDLKGEVDGKVDR